MCWRKELKNFNTSHVNVNPRTCLVFRNLMIYFNTSHVNVNRYPPEYYGTGINNFNTSHVNVNLVPFISSANAVSFQYISC